ncbi:MAG: hypothetical protein AB9895_02255 [Negativicutes bacterium]
MEKEAPKKSKIGFYLPLLLTGVAIGINELYPNFYTQSLLIAMAAIMIIQIFRKW